MTYQEWADEYTDSAVKLRNRIAALKEELHTAPVTELKDITNRINIMYSMYLDCMKTADILRKRKGEV